MNKQPVGRPVPHKLPLPPSSIQYSDLVTYNQLVPLYVMCALSLIGVGALVVMVGILMSTGSTAVTSLGGTFRRVNASQVLFAQTLFTALSRMGEGQRQAIDLLLSQHQGLDQGQAQIIQMLVSQQQLLQQNTSSIK